MISILLIIVHLSSQYYVSFSSIRKRATPSIGRLSSVSIGERRRGLREDEWGGLTWRRCKRMNLMVGA